MALAGVADVLSLFCRLLQGLLVRRRWRYTMEEREGEAMREEKGYVMLGG